MNTEKLTKLAAFLDALDPKRFDYATWVGRSWQGRQDLSCGTTACALGWACTLFPDELELRPWVCDGIVHKTHADVWLKGGTRLAFDANTRAAEKVFGLSQDEAKFLFLPSGANEEMQPPTYVAKKIRWLLEGKDHNLWRNYEQYEVHS